MIGGCGGQPPAQSGAITTSDGPTGQGAEELAAALDGLVLPAPETHLQRDRLMNAVDFSGALGEQAEDILTLLSDSERAAYAEMPEVTPESFGTLPNRAIVTAAYVPDAPQAAEHAIPQPPGAPPPTVFVLILLPGVLDAVGREGLGSQTFGPFSASASSASGGMTATSQLSTTGTATISGSVVTLEIVQGVASSVVVDAGGEVVLTKTENHKVTVRFDVCPDAAGVSSAELTQNFSLDATTNIGAGGRVGTHSTGRIVSSSSFRGQVDDSANLGSVSQDYEVEEEWQRTAAAEGGPEARRGGEYGAAMSGIKAGAPGSDGGGISVGNFSGASFESHMSGDATAENITSSVVSAAFDYAFIVDAYVEAEQLWQNSRCVMVAVEEYNAESELDVQNQGHIAHTEEVEPGSETSFEAAVKHRFSQSVSAELKAELSGPEKLDPEEIAAPPGTLTYTAPDEEGKTGTVRMTSTSRQGIGKLSIEFSGAKKLKVTIDATSTITSFGTSYITELSVPAMLLTKQEDGTWQGSGPATSTVTYVGAEMCPTPYTETGTMTLRARRGEPVPPDNEGSWLVSRVALADFTAVVSCMGQTQSIAGVDGYTGSLISILGEVELRANGEVKRVQFSQNLSGVSTEVDATVTGEVVTGDGN